MKVYSILDRFPKMGNSVFPQVGDSGAAIMECPARKEYSLSIPRTERFSARFLVLEQTTESRLNCMLSRGGKHAM